MKIIFNHNKHNWSSHVYHELINSNIKVIVPENYKEKNCGFFVDFDSLEKCARENPDADFIWDFQGNIRDLIKWTKKKINIPIVIYAVNAINNVNKFNRMSFFANVWFVEYYAKANLEKINKTNLIHECMASNQYYFHPIKEKKLYDVGFFGQHYGIRKYWISTVAKFCYENNLKYNFPRAHSEKIRLSWEDVNKIYNQTKINLSFTPMEKPGRIVNLRLFEICMAGGFQLSQYSPLIERYFEIGKEIICWKNKKELFEKITYYLENEDEREKIARNGYERAVREHNWTKRFESVNTFINKKKPLDLKEYQIDIDKIINNNSFESLKLEYRNNFLLNLKKIKILLKQKGYKIFRDLKHYNQIIIKKKRKTLENPISGYYEKSIYYDFTNLIYKPSFLEYFRFINFYGKTVIVIFIKPSNSDISLEDWIKLKEIIAMTDNPDDTLPRIGAIFNGTKLLIRDFYTVKWLRNLPTKKTIKNDFNLKKYLFVTMKYKFREYYRLYNFSKILPDFIIKHYKKYKKLEL